MGEYSVERLLGKDFFLKKEVYHAQRISRSEEIAYQLANDRCTVNLPGPDDVQ
jgi:hypothetical protein